MMRRFLVLMGLLLASSANAQPGAIGGGASAVGPNDTVQLSDGAGAFKAGPLISSLATDAEVASGYQPLNSDLTALSGLLLSSTIISFMGADTEADARAAISSVGLVGNESIDGNKTFTGNTLFTGVTTLGGLISVLGSPDNTSTILGSNLATIDFALANKTSPIRTGTDLPGSCTGSEMFIDSDAPSGQRIYLCEGGAFVSQGGASAVGPNDTIQLSDGAGGLKAGPLIDTIDNDGSWTAEVDISAGGSAACAAFNAAVAPLMAGSSTEPANIRVHHDSVPFVTLNVATDYVQHVDGGVVRYASCFVLHPMQSVANGYPAPFSPDAAKSTITNNPKIRIHFDNLNIMLDQGSMGSTVRTAAFLDVGNGWGAGEPYGSLGRGVVLDGEITARNIVQNGRGTFDTRIPLVQGRSRRFSDVFNNVHVLAAFNKSTRLDAGRLELAYGDMDDTDVICQFANVWSMRLPTCQTFSGSEGIGMQMLGVINAHGEIYKIRGADYGLVIGDPKFAGNVVHYDNCAAENDGNPETDCADYDLGVRGITLRGGTVEGNRYANLIDFGSDRRNIIRDVHFESGTGATIAERVIKPAVCRQPTPGTWEAEEFTPVGADATLDCLERVPIDLVTDIAGTSCQFSSDTVDFSDYDSGFAGADQVVTTSDSIYVRAVTDSDGVDIDRLGEVIPVAAVTPGTGPGTGITVAGACGGPVPVDGSLSTSNKGWLHVLKSGNVATRQILTGGTPNKGTFVFSGRISGSGTKSEYDDVGSPAIMIGAAFKDENTLMFTDGIIVGAGTGRWANEMFTIDASLDRRTNPNSGFSFASTVGRIDTSGLQLSSPLIRFPTFYDDWFDAREVSLLTFIQRGESGGAGTGNDSPTKNSNACVSVDSLWNSDASVACNDRLARSAGTQAHPFYLTRLVWTVIDGYAGGEGCGLGLSSSPESGTHFFEAHMPPETADGSGQVFQAGESMVYPIDTLIDAGSAIYGNMFVVEQFRGDYSGTGGPGSCIGTGVGGKVEIRGFPAPL